MQRALQSIFFLISIVFFSLGQFDWLLNGPSRIVPSLLSAIFAILIALYFKEEAL